MQGLCYVSQDICIPVKLSQLSENEYIVEDVQELITTHNKLTRTFSGIEYPSLVNGVFQRAWYAGDADSVNSKWIQYLMIHKLHTPLDIHSLKVNKIYNGNMIHFKYGEEEYLHDMYLEYCH